MTYKLRLHENSNNPKISSSELESFEKEFKNRFPNIIFYKQNRVNESNLRSPPLSRLFSPRQGLW